MLGNAVSEIPLDPLFIISRLFLCSLKCLKKAYDTVLHHGNRQSVKVRLKREPGVDIIFSVINIGFSELKTQIFMEELFNKLLSVFVFREKDMRP